ncbi:MAG: phosphoadenylyl-sulfate reductase [Pseudomonadota bacterium]
MQAQFPNTDLSQCTPAQGAATSRLDEQDIEEWNDLFQYLTAPARVELALRFFPGTHVLSSSFGAQAAVSLHLLSQAAPEIPVVLVDTGYLFPETYEFVEQLTTQLNLNLHVYRSLRSPAEQEASDGQRWLQGESGLDAYNLENKVEPMNRALEELSTGTWITGIRRSQSEHRQDTPFVQQKRQGERDLIKVSPLADWSDKDVFEYLKRFDLPYHPLWHQGYVSVGDTHTTRSIYEVDDESQVRFFGIKRECGLHL